VKSRIQIQTRIRIKVMRILNTDNKSFYIKAAQFPICIHSSSQRFFLTCRMYSSLDNNRYSPDKRNHGLNNYIDTKAKCRHLKIMTWKGTLRQVFSRVYRLEIKSVMLVFSTQLCELFPSNFLSGSLSPPPPSMCEKV
jgi:hypothetical protein